MSEYDALQAAMAADPADLTARLVFADWLEEHGAPDRAELVRLDAAERTSRLDRATGRRLRHLRRATPWLAPEELSLAEAAVVRLAAAQAVPADLASAMAPALEGVLAATPGVFPGRPGLARLVARYAAAELPRGPYTVTGHSSRYQVACYRHPAGPWCAGSGSGGGRQWPGVWAAWAESVLYGLSRRGSQEWFAGVRVALPTVGVR